MAEILDRTRAAPGESGAGRRAWASVALGLMGALAMTSCCILPLALVSLGVSGVFIGRLAELDQYHVYFLAFALVTIALGMRKAYGRAGGANCTAGNCAAPINRTLMRALLWLALGIVLVAEIFRYLAPWLLNPF